MPDHELCRMPSPRHGGDSSGRLAGFGRLVEGPARVDGVTGTDRRGELRQRLPDGIRGTDDERAGPLRLVGSSSPRPGCTHRGRTVLSVAAVAGGDSGAGERTVADRSRCGVHRGCLALHRRITTVRVCRVRRGCGVRVLRPGSRPGTQFTQALRVDWVGLVLAVAVGGLSSAVLVANNLRDIPTDRVAGEDHAGGTTR